MTSTILFLTLLALLVLLIVAYRGDFAEPSILFVVGFTLAVFNGLTNYRTWDFDLSMQTCFVVGFGTFAFALTAYGVKVFFRSCVGHRTAHREYGEPQDIVRPAVHRFGIADRVTADNLIDTALRGRRLSEQSHRLV